METSSRAFAVDQRLIGGVVPGRARSSQTARIETDLFSADWWSACIGILAITLAPWAGDIAIGVYLVCCAVTFARHPRSSSLALVRSVWLMALPALALFSTLWSEAPDITEKQAAELVLFFATATTLCRPIRLASMAAALQLGTLVCCILCLAMQPNALLGEPLHSVLGSKNQVAFVAQILLLSSLAVAADSRAPRLLRLQAIAAIALAALEIHLAQSAGGLVSSVGAVAAFVDLVLIGRLRLAPRLALVAGGIVTISPLLIVIGDLVRQVQEFQISVLHKDATLTGRTELWTFAKSLIAERPILGHGYAAFWRQGNSDAEGLWQQFGIGSRMGFNFHNQFIEAQVDLGLLGLLVLLAVLLCVGLPSIWRAIQKPSLGRAFAASLLVALYMKLPVESVLIGSWNIYTLIFIMLGINAGMGEDARQADDGARRPNAHAPRRDSTGRRSWQSAWLAAS